LGGADLITKDMEFAYPQYSVESIVEKNPYVIIADSNTTLEYLQSHEALGQLDAVKSGRVIIMDADTVSRPTLRFISEIKKCIEKMHTF
jgi:iron complex transport system substrate-binding protein